MPTATFWDWVWTIGGPFVILSVVGFLFYTGKFILKAEYDRMNYVKDKIITEKDLRIAELWDMVKTSMSVSEKMLDKRRKRGV